MYYLFKLASFSVKSNDDLMKTRPVIYVGIKTYYSSKEIKSMSIDFLLKSKFNIDNPDMNTSFEGLLEDGNSFYSYYIQLISLRLILLEKLLSRQLQWMLLMANSIYRVTIIWPNMKLYHFHQWYGICLHLLR